MIHYFDSSDLSGVDSRTKSMLEGVMVQCKKETGLNSWISFEKKCRPFSMSYNLDGDDVTGFSVLRQGAVEYGQVLQLIYIKEDCRGGSLARNLVKEVLKNAKGDVYVEPTSHGAMIFVKRLGFEIVDNFDRMPVGELTGNPGRYVSTDSEGRKYYNYVFSSKDGLEQIDYDTGAGVGWKTTRFIGKISLE